MLPREIGRQTLERAAFHEAGHFVCFIANGGEPMQMYVCFDHGTKQWSGAVECKALPDPALQAEMFLCGGLSEFRYMANVYQTENWEIDPETAVAAISAMFGKDATELSATLQVLSDQEHVRDVSVDIDMFSNDVLRARRICTDNNIGLEGVIHSAVARVNGGVFWDEVINVAKVFLLKPPRLLGWQFSPDDEVGSGQYNVGHIAQKVREQLLK